MRKLIFILLVGVLPMVSCAQSDDKNKQQILALLQRQASDWNRGDIEGFMVGYWNNDSLMFIGQSGVTYGYDKTLANYKKNYSDTAQMGRLAFNILHVKKLSPEYYYVIGKWFLNRSVGDVGGHFNLLFRKINGQWVIVADHSS
jgi:hypothetical protein